MSSVQHSSVAKDSGSETMVLVPFVALWPKNWGTLPLFLGDTLDAKMLRKWHPGGQKSD